ncbi:MAG: class I SAM-dependent methyltransferase [bacterium]
MHQRIEDVAKEVIGIDVSAEAIGFLRAAGMSTVYLGDAEKLSAAPLRGAFDVVVAGELMEHLENPGCFLEGVRGVLTRGGSLLVTTANALSVLGAMRAMLGREIVHPEHTFYFSQRTLSELCSRYDFKCVEYGFYAPPTRSALKKAMRRPLESWWRHLSPWSAPGLVARYEGRTT